MSLASSIAKNHSPAKPRLSRLLAKHEVIEFMDEDDNAQFLWIQAMNSVQREEALRSASIIMAKTRLTLVPGNPEYDHILEQLETMEVDEIIEAVLIGLHGAEILSGAVDDIAADDAWIETGKLDLVEYGEEVIQSGLELPPDEQETFSAIMAEYQADLTKYMQVRFNLKRSEMTTIPRPKLIEFYMDARVAAETIKARDLEYYTVAIYHCCRICQADRTGRKLDHGACGRHGDLEFESINHVRDLPDELKAEIIQVIQRLDSAGDALGGEQPRRAQH